MAKKWIGVKKVAEYIDKALLKELLERYGCDKDLLGIVDCIPTDEDVLRVVRCRDCVYEQNCTLPGVPVVRCKDCKYFDSGDNVVDKWEYCKKNCIDVSEEWFCKSGIRKENKVE